MIPHDRDDIQLPCDCEPPFRPSAECAPAGRGRPFDTARAGLTLYTLGSNRSRYQIIRDYARRHNLTVGEIDQLVRALPDYGAQSMLAGSVAALNVSAEIINLAAARAERARRRG